MAVTSYSYPLYAKLTHMGLAIFGVGAYLTAELAEGGSASSGYLLHAYLGLSLAFFMAMRVVTGLSSHGSVSFYGWRPFSRSQLQMALADFRALLALRMPEHDHHQGLAGVTQAFGLIVFAWMGMTGSAIYFLNTGTETALFEVVEELHEIGETLVPLYLLLHVGAVILHAVSGKPVWRKMFGRD